jgi:hypothetical protein
LGTPSERMQSASLSAGASPLPVAAPLFDPPEDPQAAIATEHVITTNVISRLLTLRWTIASCSSGRRVTPA